MSVEHPNTKVLLTIICVLHFCTVTPFDITSSRPTNDGITEHVHGRLILEKSMLVNDPYFVDPAQLVIGMTPAENIKAFGEHRNYLDIFVDSYTQKYQLLYLPFRGHCSERKENMIFENLFQS